MGFLLPACAVTDDFADLGVSDAQFGDGISAVCTDPNGDWEKDGIPDGEEGCLQPRDSDGDGTPDWQDFDSDDDGVPDDIESGERDENGKCKGAPPPNDSWPCDTDGDGFDDYLDVDSDGDGLRDGEEDSSGDGLLGCCLAECNKPDEKWQKDNCILTEDGCGTGQECTGGKCTPAVIFNCSDGETNPFTKDTFGDGKLDNERGTFICRDATENKPQGRKMVQTQRNTTGDWHLALEMEAEYGELTLVDPSP
ncbi:MAG: hypothetical protein V1754_03745, partial [Pseudomonadota bacterium]